MLALFYFGRLDRFPPKAIGDAIAKEAMTWKPADSQSEADRCGKELIDKAEIMNEAGKNLIHRGMGLDKEGDSPTDAPARTAARSNIAPIPTPRPRILSHRIRRHQEEGTCVVRLLVNVDGYIRATQLLSSTGFERMNRLSVQFHRRAHDPHRRERRLQHRRTSTLPGDCHRRECDLCEERSLNVQDIERKENTIISKAGQSAPDRFRFQGKL